MGFKLIEKLCTEEWHCDKDCYNGTYWNDIQIIAHCFIIPQFILSFIGIRRHLNKYVRPN